MSARTFNVVVSPDDLSAEKTVVSVSLGLYYWYMGYLVCTNLTWIDITEFLDTEIKGPAKFSCKTGSECKFEEPGMTDLIDTIFGDNYITLKCNSGECLHYSQVPGYVVGRLISIT